MALQTQLPLAMPSSLVTAPVQVWAASLLIQNGKEQMVGQSLRLLPPTEEGVPGPWHPPARTCRRSCSGSEPAAGGLSL